MSRVFGRAFQYVSYLQPIMFAILVKNSFPHIFDCEMFVVPGISDLP